MTQSRWNFGYNFNIPLPTYIGYYFRLCAPSSKQIILICSALTSRNRPKNLGVKCIIAIAATHETKVVTYHTWWLDSKKPK